MILLDANVIIRLLAEAITPSDQKMQSIALDLFEAVELGEADVMVSDSVLAEVAFTMTSPKHYALDVREFIEKLSAIVRLENVRTADRQTLLHALKLWANHPRLGFVDSVIAAQAQRLNVQLLTFDSDFDAVEGIERWSPEAPVDE